MKQMAGEEDHQKYGSLQKALVKLNIVTILRFHTCELSFR